MVKWSSNGATRGRAIAQKTAKRVSIQNPGKFQRRQVTGCKENQVIYYGKDPKRSWYRTWRKTKNSSIAHDWIGFQYILEDARLPWCYDIYSNCIHAVLNAYGVEAARETIIREIKHVFNSYGICQYTAFVTCCWFYDPYRWVSSNEPIWGHIRVNITFE